MDKYERESTIKAEITFKVSGSNTDPYDNSVNVNVIRPNDTYMYSGATATRLDTGEYRYFISSNTSDMLGIYTIVWKAEHDVGGTQGLMPLVQRDYFQLVMYD